MRFLFVVVNAVLCSATKTLYATDCEDGAPNSLRTLLASECDGGECEARVILACTPTLVSLGQLEISEGMSVTISGETDTTTIVDGTSAPAADRGGWIYMTGGELTIEGLTIQNFTASTRGGVIGMRGSGNMRCVRIESQRVVELSVARVERPDGVSSLSFCLLSDVTG